MDSQTPQPFLITQESDPDLFYTYCPLLMEQIPELTVDTLILLSRYCYYSPALLTLPFSQPTKTKYKHFTPSLQTTQT